MPPEGVDQSAPTVLWTPDVEDVAEADLSRFMAWLDDRRGFSFLDYNALWRWSVQELEEFWEAIWDYFELHSPTPYRAVLDERRMPGAEWFAGAKINYAEEMLRRAGDDHPAILSVREGREIREISPARLRAEVGSLAGRLRAAGVMPGDLVVAYLPNWPEAVVGLLATAAVGAIWAVCGPDFGIEGALARFEQLEPKVLIGCARYRFGGREYERGEELRQLAAGLPTVELKVSVGEGVEGFVPWTTLVADDVRLEFEPVDFGHPLWVLFSSGTTGNPKGIVHGHGGIVLEHLKSIVLGIDTRPGDRLFYYCSTSWMVWNYMIGGLLAGASVVLYDGSAVWPDVAGAWQVAANTKATLFGTGAAYLDRCEQKGLDLSALDLSHLRTVVSTGSILPTRAALWFSANAPRRVRLDSSSGGTDVCTAFVGGSPTQPVVLDRIGGACLGADVQAWDESGQELIGETGEMVVTKPMPSMPLYFWNDPDGARYRDAYFSTYPGVWRHGDWIRRWEDGSFSIEGRSDATLNRGGVRMGPADIYAVVEGLEDVEDSLVIGLEQPDGRYSMPLFVVPRAGGEFDHRLKEEIVATIRRELSPRHVPDAIYAVPAIPRTPTGKKQEVLVKRILAGTAPPADTAALAWFEEFSRREGS